MRSGRSRSSCAARRGDEVPTTAPCFSVSIDAAPTIRSRTSPRGRTAAMWISSGRIAFDILHRMDAEIDFALEQRAVELLGPQRLAADLGERPVLDLVAGGRDRDDLDPAVGPALRGLDRRGDLARLRERQRRSASPEAKSLHAPPLVHCRGIRQRAGREMTVILGLESSCDDSAAALVTGDRRILAQAVVGQNSGASALWRRRAGDRRARACRDPARR